MVCRSVNYFLNLFPDVSATTTTDETIDYATDNVETIVLSVYFIKFVKLFIVFLLHFA